jgi:ribosomal-protein-alanine N-acetyltransferase
VLRDWKDEDLPAFAALNADPAVMEHFPKRLEPAESHELAAKIRGALATNPFGWWALEVPGVTPFAGFVGLSAPSFEAPFTPAIEVGWRLARSAWGHGFATEAARAAVAYGFDVLGLDEIVSLTVPANTRSRHVMEKLGMTRNPDDDFDHPRLPEGHPLRRHVLYRLRRPA